MLELTLQLLGSLTRGASASPASSVGITTNTSDIFKVANWNSDSVFQWLKHKEVDRAAYQRAVISRIAWGQLQTTVDV